MGHIKSRNGALLSRGGHLCLTCCGHNCNSPDCINFAVLFPRVYPPSAPQYQPRSKYCTGLFGSTRTSTTYISDIPNTLDVDGDLVVTALSGFDDDLEVDGVSIGGDCSEPIALPAGYVIANGIPPGGTVNLTVVDNYGIYSGGSGCACWVPSAPLGSVNPRLVSPLFQDSFTASAKARFEVCKTCPESPDGFTCHLFNGCCFGSRRTDPSFHCPSGRW